jgi:hypothetical protein
MPPPRAVAVRRLCSAHPLTTSVRTVLVITGPTGTGKTNLSLRVAGRIKDIAEIVSADSVQVYRGLDIGSAKLPPDPSSERGPNAWRSGIRHHLIDVARAEWDYSAGEAHWSASNSHAAGTRVCIRRLCGRRCARDRRSALARPCGDGCGRIIHVHPTSHRQGASACIPRYTSHTCRHARAFTGEYHRGPPASPSAWHAVCPLAFPRTSLPTSRLRTSRSLCISACACACALCVHVVVCAHARASAHIWKGRNGMAQLQPIQLTAYQRKGTPPAAYTHSHAAAGAARRRAAAHRAARVTADGRGLGGRVGAALAAPARPTPQCTCAVLPRSR